MFKSLRMLAFVTAVALCSGCGPSAPATTPVLDANGRPTGQVVQQPDQGHPFLAALGGSFLGNMLGNHFSRPSGGGAVVAAPAPSHTVVVNKTVVNKTIINRPEVKTSPSVQPPKPTTSQQYRASSPSSRSSSSYSSRSYSSGSFRSSGRR